MLNRVYALNLVSGPLPVVALGLGALALAYLLIRRSPRWWVYSAVTAVVSAAAAMALEWAVIDVWYWWPEDLPATVIACVGFAIWGLILGITAAITGLGARERPVKASRHVAPARHPVPHPAPGAARRLGVSVPRRLGSMGAAVVIVAVSAIQVNAYFGEYPTIGSLIHGAPAVATGVPHFLQTKSANRFDTKPVMDGWHPPKGMMKNGEMRQAPIPGKLSGFHARNAIIYLPPAYFTKHRPLLPVLVLVAGQPGAPSDWLQSAHLASVLDGYAQAHKGLAPVVVMPDPNGAQESNTMCMNSALGKVDTYMAKDVPNWITKTLDIDTNHRHWAVGGFSYGGTCAMQMVTRHPDVYPNFVAISSEREPALTSNRTVTIARAFNGDTAAFNAVVPLTLLKEHRYPEVHGWLASGAGDGVYTNNAIALQAAGKKAGMNLSRTTFPGGHSWIMVTEALPSAFSFLGTRLGLQ